ncbi:Polysaccharide lyase [Caballeronia sp. SBC1]|uniref:heparin lyase I family protein n=1 Tax=Caballeronia sp. SBC1 TaxID=2705548 RepID=UPI00140F2304|nr:heparin lyase I family protein [Caballeronia sp. SBC1]QIN60058.1 Polysaccharide lyase [Caballeronia sp. SBC1]
MNKKWMDAARQCIAFAALRQQWSVSGNEPNGANANLIEGRFPTISLLDREHGIDPAMAHAGNLPGRHRVTYDPLVCGCDAAHARLMIAVPLVHESRIVRHDKTMGWFRRLVGLAALSSCGLAVAQAPVVTWTDPDTQGWAATYDPLYVADWRGGIDPEIDVQSNPGDISVVADPVVPGRNALRASISITENFSGVANGTPRAEVLFPAPVTFAQGKDYLIRWSTFLPIGFVFDSKQLVIVTQIHQSLTTGSPTIALGLLGTQYGISERGGSNPTVASGGKWLCCADADRGKWVNWALRYVPDETGQHSSLELYKDGTSVYAVQGAPNAYMTDQSAYLKMGLYKAGWKTQPSDVTQITMFFGPVYVSQR